MNLLGPVKSFDRLQRRHAVDAAALIAYWVFLSLFPLLLVFVTILGFVLQGDPGAQRSVLHSLAQFPITGTHVGSLRGSGVGLAIGIAGTLWSGLGLTVAVENAFN